MADDKIQPDGTAAEPSPASEKFSEVIYEPRDCRCGWPLAELEDRPPASPRPQLGIAKGLQSCDEAARAAEKEPGQPAAG